MKWFNIWFTNEIIVSLNNELSKNWECTFVSNDKEQNNEGILGDENTEEEVQEKSQDEIQTENDKPPKITCSSCGEENPKSNLFCKSCGAPFVQKVFCQQCNAEMPVYNSFCSKCGGVLKQNIPRIQQTSGNTSISLPASGHPIVDSQRYYVAPPPVNFQKLQEQKRLSKYQTYNTIGTVIGALLIFSGFISLILFMIVASVDDVVPSESKASYYGFLIAIFIPSIIGTFIIGISLIKYRPEGNAWKGFYYTLRYLFVGFSSILAVLIVLSIGSWIFYNPSTRINGSIPFWLFVMIKIPIVDFKIVALMSIITTVFLLCVVSMVLPTSIRLYKKFQKKRKISDEVTPDVHSSEKSIDIELEQEKNFPEESGVKLSVFEKRKGQLNSLFYILKNNPVVGSVELLGLSFVLSVIIIFILSPFIGGDNGTPASGEPINPFISVLLLAWAGISEEISFRIFIIGIPMIFIMLIRYLMQQNKNLEPKSRIADDRMEVLTKTEKSFPAKIKIWDIPLAIRGKYKKISYPEWTLIIISSTLFGFAHWEKWTGSWGAWKIFQAGVAGLILSYAFVKYGIESAIFIHVSNNVCIGLLALSQEAGASWIAGITAFIIACFWGIGIIKIISVIINFSLKMYYYKEDSKNLKY